MENKTTIRIVKQGYRPDEYSEKDHIFGSGATPDPIILYSGNWREAVPLIEEFQALKGFETFGCVTWTILNALEKLAKIVFNEDWNKAERFTYIASRTDPADRGNSPRTVADSVRKMGTADETDLPFDDSIDTLEKFNSPRPLTKSLLEKGKVFLNKITFRYDFLPPTGGTISRETLREALKRSPVAIAVYAWVERDGVYVRPEGGADLHLTLLENVKDNGELEIFDSYPPADKTLSKDFPIYVAMRFHIKTNTIPQQLSILSKWLDLLLKWLGMIVKQPVLTPVSVVNLPQVATSASPVSNEPPPLKLSLLEPFCQAITTYENMPVSYRNPGALKFSSYVESLGATSERAGFAVFPDMETGEGALRQFVLDASHNLLRDYHDKDILGFFSVYAPSNDSNNPVLYANFVASRCNVIVTAKLKDII